MINDFDCFLGRITMHHYFATLFVHNCIYICFITLSILVVFHTIQSQNSNIFLHSPPPGVEANLRATLMLSGSQQVVIRCMLSADGCDGDIVGVAITGGWMDKPIRAS